MKTAEIKKVEKISKPFIGDEHFLQIKVMNIYANYKVEYFLMLRDVVFMQKKKRICILFLFFIHLQYNLLIFKYKTNENNRNYSTKKRCKPKSAIIAMYFPSVGAVVPLIEIEIGEKIRNTVPCINRIYQNFFLNFIHINILIYEKDNNINHFLCTYFLLFLSKRNKR